MSENEKELPNQAPASATSSPAGSAGPSFSGEIIANLLEITERRLQQLVKEGWITRPERGKYSLRDSIRGYIRSLKQNQREQQRGAGSARLAMAQALKVEMENFKRMGELLVKQQVDETMAGLVVIMKSGLEGLPGRLSSELAAISDAPAIYQRLQSEHRAVLNQCADYLEKRADALEAMPDPSASHAPLSPTDSDEVGGAESEDAAG